MAAGDHAAHIVVHSAAEDRAEHDPQENHRPEHRAHQRPEDRARAGNVQQLHQVGLPGLHGNAVHAVIDSHSRGLPLIRGKYSVHHAAVNQVSDQQDSQGKNK